MRRISAVLGTGLVILYFAFALVILLLRYAVLPHVDHYRGALETLASEALHQKISIAAVRADWVGLRPRLTLSDVIVYDRAGREALRLPEVSATVAWESVTVLAPRLKELRITDPDLDVRRDATGHLTVAGIPIDLDASNRGDGVGGWVLDQYAIAIRHAHVRWTDELRQAPALDLRDVDFELLRSGIRHRFAFSATPPPGLAAPLELKGYIARGLFARESDADHWSGEVYANLGYIDLARLRTYVDYPFAVARGQGALRVWVRFSEALEKRARATRLFDVTADVRLADVSARGAPDLAPLSLASMQGRLLLHQTASSDRLTLDHLSLHTAQGLELQSLELDVQRTFDKQGRPLSTALQTKRLDLQTVADLAARLPLPDDARDLLVRYRPRGRLATLELNWHGAINAPGSFHVATTFTGLGIDAAAPSGTKLAQPGFANLSGQLSADQSGGHLAVHAENGTLSLPGFFAEPEIPLDHLDAALRWAQTGPNLELHLTSLRFDNADAAGSAEAVFRQGPASGSQGPGYLDLSAKLTRADVRRVARYLPQSIPEDVRSFIDRALVSGTSDDVSFRVLGALERFPFRQNASAAALPKAGAPGPAPQNPGTAPGSEQFRITANLHAVKLDYAPAPLANPAAGSIWPPIDDLEADLALERGRMEITARSARVYGFKLDRVKVELPNIDDHTEVMQIRGGGSGPLADLVQLANNSPIEGWLDHFTRTIHAAGPARLALTLALPLARMDDAKVEGSIDFQGNDIGLLPHLPLLAHTMGRFDFTDSGLALSNVSAQFLGGTAKVEAETAADRFIQIRAEGTVEAQALKSDTELTDLAFLTSHLDGATTYKATVNLAPRSADERAIAAHGPRLRVESSLAGLGIDLPQPLQKLPAEVLPTQVELDAPRGAKDETSDQVRVRVGTIVSAILQRRQMPGGSMEIVHSGVGVNEAATLSEARASLNLTLPSLDLDAWQAVLDNAPAGSANDTGKAPAASPILIPDSIIGRVKTLRVDNKNFTNVALNATHAGSTWQGNVASDELTGSFNWRQGELAGAQQNRITARLTKLVVPRAATSEVTTLLDPGPSSIPALDITVDDFTLRDKQLGRLELVASNSTRQGRRQWQLQKLNVTNADGGLEATGTWGPDSDMPGGTPLTRMHFTVNASNVGALMDRLGVAGAIKDGTATLKGDVDWHGSPLAVDYDSLSGNLNLRADRGQFLKADPGAAKLLGVLSLQSLTRRFTLDFTDLFAGGFAFDEIEADVKVREGVASTDNFAMRGVSAIVAIDGSADLAHETQNLHVRVLPQVNLGTGSIAYALLVNPIIGLGTLAIGEVLRDPISKALAFEYNVTGPWADPTIVKSVKRVGAAVEPALPLPNAPAPALPAQPALPTGQRQSLAQPP